MCRDQIIPVTFTVRVYLIVVSHVDRNVCRNPFLH